MGGLVVVLSIGLGMLSPPPQAPYVSCPGGYIATTGSECPRFQTPLSPSPGHGGGGGNLPVGGGRGGLLGLGIGGIL